MIYKMEAEKKFPQRVKIGHRASGIGHRAVGWVEAEVAQRVADRIASSWV